MTEVEQGAPSDADVAFMRRAIEWGRRGERKPGGSPIGCVIVLDGRVIGEGHNENELRGVPIAHGELVAIERACHAIGKPELRGATLYSTLQPCGMCTLACVWAKVGRIVYGARRGEVHEAYFDERHISTEDLIRDAYRTDLNVHGGVLAAECAALYIGPDEELPKEEMFNL